MKNIPTRRAMVLFAVAGAVAFASPAEAQQWSSWEERIFYDFYDSLTYEEHAVQYCAPNLQGDWKNGNPELSSLAIEYYFVFVHQCADALAFALPAEAQQRSWEDLIRNAPDDSFTDEERKISICASKIGFDYLRSSGRISSPSQENEFVRQCAKWSN